MGLDQYAYEVEPHPLNTDFSYVAEDENEFSRRNEIAYWRKHPNLQGWMEKLFFARAKAQGFNNGKVHNNTVVAQVVGELDKDTAPAEIIAKAMTDDEMKKAIEAEQEAAKLANLTKPMVFNCQPIRLNTADLDQLEMHILMKNLPGTTGFFFGDDSDDYYREKDLEFIEKARQSIANGYDVYYDSWW